jgi:hypothetical protein
MTQAHQERIRAAELPAGSIVAVLLEQHADIRELFQQTMQAHGDARRQAFDQLRELLAVHEAGEEIIVRPVSRRAQDGGIASARNEEEKEAASVLAGMEKLDLNSPEFAAKLAELEQAVSDHADAEESEEFPYILATTDTEQQTKMGSRLLKVQRAAPTHPHPTAAGSPAAQMATGPFAALLDRARDAFHKNSD